MRKIRRLLNLEPLDPSVCPESFASLRSNFLPRKGGSLLSFQLIPDKFYFLLFGAIRMRLETYIPIRSEVVIVRSVNGSIGTGWFAELIRSSPIAWLLSRQWVRAYGDLINAVAYRCATWSHPFLDLMDWYRSGTLWRKLQKQGESLSLIINGIEVADLLVDSYLRFKPSPEFDVKNPFVRRLLWQALRDVRQAQSYFGGRCRPLWYMTSYTIYLEHGIPTRVALSKGVTVWSFGNLNSFGKRLTQIDHFHTQNFSHYRSEFERLNRQVDRLQQARDQLEFRLRGGIDAATSYMRQSAYTQTNVELPAGLEASVVVFLHDFYDSPHVYPDLVFMDFWRWICFTIEVLQKYGITFFLKPHPNQISLSDVALERLRQKYPKLKWLPAEASNVQIVQAGIACGVTVYGTVAHELAYLGVPSIGCARHPHYTFDFCRTARTIEEYEYMLRTYKVLPVSKEEMRRQALAFYYMHNLYAVGNERKLQQAFVKLWQACNEDDVDAGAVINNFQALIKLPAFDRFVKAMASSIKESRE